MLPRYERSDTITSGNGFVRCRHACSIAGSRPGGCAIDVAGAVGHAGRRIVLHSTGHTGHASPGRITGSAGRGARLGTWTNQGPGTRDRGCIRQCRQDRHIEEFNELCRRPSCGSGRSQVEICAETRQLPTGSRRLSIRGLVHGLSCTGNARSTILRSCFLLVHGGEGEIRTLGTLITFVRFRGGCLKPLDHLSVAGTGHSTSRQARYLLRAVRAYS
jgi:hypothetical protein